MAQRKGSLADDLVLLPWWVSLVLAILVYTLLPTVLPVSMGGLTPIATFFFVAMAVISALRSWKTAAMLEGQTSLTHCASRPRNGSRIC